MTYGEAYERVRKGERFEDLEILRVTRIYDGWSVAHSQALKGWTTLDPDILSLRGGDGETVLDVMLEEGWEPKTEEEKLVVFTVKAGA